MLYDPIRVKKDVEHTVFVQKSNRIIEVHWSDNFIYETEHIIDNFEQLKSLFKNEKLLVLNWFAPYTQLSIEARLLLAQGLHLNIVTADAYVICSLAQSLIVNFLIRVDKPIVPSNCFTNKKEAEEWLLNFDKKVNPRKNLKTMI